MLLAQLRRDISRFDQECAAICFAELGRIDPKQAILALPVLLRYPSQYWEHILAEFLSKAPVCALLGRPFRTAWQTSLAAIALDPFLAPAINMASPGLGEMSPSLRDVFRHAGAQLHTSGLTITLSDATNPLSFVAIPLANAVPRYAHANEDLTNEMMRGDFTLADILARTSAEVITC